MNIPDKQEISWKSLILRFLFFFLIVILGLLADLWTKSYFFQKLGMPGQQAEIDWVISDVFGFQTALNQGALFGIGQGMRTLFCTVSFTALFFIFFWLFIFKFAKSWIWICSLGMISAGILGNLYDRLGLHGLKWEVDGKMEPIYAVRDWIVVMLGSYHWPNFNIADSLLVCGAIFVFLATYFMETSSLKSENEDKKSV
ncbi:MAG: signal peptidase II [Planctomycetia bacterium]|nr:signal peptidase II [Planctomycetia bacterium]